MRYCGMNEEEFLKYLFEMLDKCIKAQLEEKKWLKEQGCGDKYDQ